MFSQHVIAACQLQSTHNLQQDTCAGASLKLVQQWTFHACRPPHVPEAVSTCYHHLCVLDMFVCACSDADRQAAKGIRMLHPATAEDVLAEEQAAAEQLMQQMQADEQQASTQRGSRPPSATQRPPLPNISPRSSNCAAAVPTGVAAAASPIVRRNSACKSAASPEPPQPQQQYMHDPSSTSGSPEQARSGHMNSTKGNISGLSTPPAGQSAPGSHRGTPEPYADMGAHQMQQQVPRGYSVTPRDSGNASCVGVSVAAGQTEAGDMSRQLYAEQSQGSVARQFLQQHQVMQQRAWGAEQPAHQQSHCMQYSPSPQRQQPLQLPAQWPRPPEHVSVSVSASRTNVLYAVMALLGELDVSGLSIVQREVQLRLTEHQQ